MNKLSMFGLIALAGVGTSLGCPVVKETACQIIKTAADVCTVIEYVGEDGKTYRVQVTKDQVESMAFEAAQRDGIPAPKNVKAMTVAPPASAPAAPPAAEPAPVAPKASAAASSSAAPVSSAKPAPKAKK